MSELELYKIAFAKKELKGLDHKEVLFIIQMANLLQDLSVLKKVIYISSKGVKNDIERMAENSQALFFHRILTGILFEGWGMINSRRYRDVIGIYRPLFDDKAKKSLEAIENYFETSNNLIKKLRNKFSFHYDFGQICNQFEKLPDSKELHMFITEEHENCRYTASDQIIVGAILRLMGEADEESAIEKMLAEVRGITEKFLDVGGECILVFVKRTNLSGKPVALKNVPKLDELRLNYFVTR